MIDMRITIKLPVNVTTSVESRLKEAIKAIEAIKKDHPNVRFGIVDVVVGT